MSGIEGKVVVVTGASSGIGAAIAVHLGRRGASVVLGARRTDRVEAVAAGIVADGGSAAAATVDVTRAEDLERLVATAVDRFGRLDVLVANAGVARTSLVADLDVSGWDAMIDVNLRGVLNAVAAALPVFRRQGRGHLVTIQSTAELKITPTMAVYGATKSAVRVVLEGLRRESTDGTVRTTAITPGMVRSELVDNITDLATRAALQQRSAELAIGPDAIARAVAFAVEQPDDVEIGEIVVRPTAQD